MSVSRRLFWLLCALSLVAAGAAHGCGGTECLRDSDCGNHLECRVGVCAKPLPAAPRAPMSAGGAGGADDEAPDASTPGGSTSSAGKTSSAGASSGGKSSGGAATLPEAGVGVGGDGGAAGAGGVSS